MRVQSNRKEVVERFKRAFRATAIALDEANKSAIQNPHYWQGFEGRTTYRQSGEVVEGAYRNIFDLGNLYFGQDIQIDNAKAILSWDGKGITPAAEVYFGRRTATGWIPGRQWVDVALQEVDLPLVFQNNF